VSNRDIKILCVDDEVEILEIYRSFIERIGFSPVICRSGQAAIEHLQTDNATFLMIISDYMMPEMNGLELRQALLADFPQIPFVVVSAFVTKEMALDAFNLKIEGFYDKPVDDGQLKKIIEAHGRSRLEAIRESQALEAIFIDEASNIIEEMDSVLLGLDGDRNNQELLNLIYRGAHTIKGSSGILSTDIVTRYVHKYEDIISSVKKGQQQFTDEVYEVLLRGFDRIRSLIAAVAAGEARRFRLDSLLPELELKGSAGAQPVAVAEAARSGGAAAPSSLQKPKENISVPVAMLDELSGYSGEITVIRNMVNKLVRSLERQFIGNRDIQSLGELLDEMHKINSTIQTRITDLRKVPLTGVLKPLPRIIRDLSKDLDKPIKLSIHGENLRVDSALAAVCSNSLVHIVRNSADHGIENRADRAAAGKMETGTINIRCEEFRDEVVITIADDGRGIDREKIKQKALEKGLYTATELAEMTEQQQFAIIFASGFSTAAKVTDVSGRGVGMDMVRSSVEAIGGEIVVESGVGQGTTIKLHLPIPKSVLIINSLLVDAGGRSFAVPQDSIVRVLQIDPEHYRDMVQGVATSRVLRCGQEIFPLVDLADLLCGFVEGQRLAPDQVNPASIEVLILRSEGVQYAMRVDQIHDSEEIVVKRIQACFNTKGLFGGATFMGDGTIGLILDVKGVAEMAGIKAVSLAASQAAGAAAGLQASAQQDYLLFSLGTRALFGIPLEQVFRLEEIEESSVQRSGDQRVVVYRDEVMPLLSFSSLLRLSGSNAQPTPVAGRKIPTIVARKADRYYGLEVSSVVDIASTEAQMSDSVRDRIGVVGNTVIRDQNVTIVHLPQVLNQ
jgi:two-component system chemotaxis sensor kinase CheA